MLEFVGFVLQTQKASSAFQNSSLLKLMNNLSKGIVQSILLVTRGNQLRCLILTDTYRFIIVMVQVIVRTHKLKKKKSKKVFAS